MCERDGQLWTIPFVRGGFALFLAICVLLCPTLHAERGGEPGGLRPGAPPPTGGPRLRSSAPAPPTRRAPRQKRLLRKAPPGGGQKRLRRQAPSASKNAPSNESSRQAPSKKSQSSQSNSQNESGQRQAPGSGRRPPPRKKVQKAQCRLQLVVQEDPNRRKFYASYWVFAGPNPVRLIKKRFIQTQQRFISERSFEVAAGQTSGDSIGYLFQSEDRPSGYGVEARVGRNQCEGSPLDIDKTLRERYMNKIFNDIFGRKPTKIERQEDYWDLPDVIRLLNISDLFDSREKRASELDEYYRRVMGGEPIPKDVLERFLKYDNNREAINAFLASEEYYERTGAAHINFIYALHRVLLGRDPKEKELTLFMQTLSYGIPREKIVTFVVDSDDHQKLLIHTWTYKYLGRWANPLEIKLYMTMLKEKYSWADVQATIVSSQEYYHRSMLTQ